MNYADERVDVIRYGQLLVEHAVYLASYSQHEKEASDELR